MNHSSLPDPFTSLISFSFEEEMIEQEETRLKVRQITKALNELTPREKEAIYLRYFDDLSYQEIAQLMQISLKRAYNLVHEAKTALKKSPYLTKITTYLLLWISSLTI